MGSSAIALRPLTVQVDGERHSVQPGEQVPGWDGFAFRAKEALVDNEKVMVIPSLEVLGQMAADYYQHTLVPADGAPVLSDEALLRMVEERGITVNPNAQVEGETHGFPHAEGSGWYTLSDGSRVRGKAVADAAQALLNPNEA